MASPRVIRTITCCEHPAPTGTCLHTPVLVNSIVLFERAGVFVAGVVVGIDIDGRIRVRTAGSGTLADVGTFYNKPDVEAERLAVVDKDAVRVISPAPGAPPLGALVSYKALSESATGMVVGVNTCAHTVTVWDEARGSSTHEWRDVCIVGCNLPLSPRAAGRARGEGETARAAGRARGEGEALVGGGGGGSGRAVGGAGGAPKPQDVALLCEDDMHAELVGACSPNAPADEARNLVERAVALHMARALSAEAQRLFYAEADSRAGILLTLHGDGAAAQFDVPVLQPRARGPLFVVGDGWDAAAALERSRRGLYYYGGNAARFFASSDSLSWNRAIVTFSGSGLGCGEQASAALHGLLRRAGPDAAVTLITADGSAAEHFAQILSAGGWKVKAARRVVVWTDGRAVASATYVNNCAMLANWDAERGPARVEQTAEEDGSGDSVHTYCT